MAESSRLVHADRASAIAVAFVCLSTWFTANSNGRLARLFTARPDDGHVLLLAHVDGYVVGDVVGQHPKAVTRACSR